MFVNPQRTILQRLIKQQQQQQHAISNIILRPMTVISRQSAEEYKKLNYTTRMKETGRPVSPHVTIYSLPITAISSITNRGTGMALSIGCAGLGAIELFSGTSPGASYAFMQSIGNDYGVLVSSTAKFAVGFPIIYHYLGAIRHLAWDYKPDYFLTNPSVEKSSYYLLGSSIALSLGLMVI